MSAVDLLLKETLQELQSLSSLSNFPLAGGTNLALRYNHRKSIDIDLICNKIIGKKGLQVIINEITDYFGEDKVIINLINEELDEQFSFLRCFITKKGLTIKVEILQNLQFLFPPENFEGFKVLSKIDVGLLKLMSASNRFVKKDIYDLDYITDDIDIVDLFNHFKRKQETFNKPEHRNLFDLDDEISPIEDLSLLLEFDNQNIKSKNKPFHSDDRIDIVEGGKSWQNARLNWRSKMRKLYATEAKEFPGPKGIDIS